MSFEIPSWFTAHYFTALVFENGVWRPGSNVITTYTHDTLSIDFYKAKYAYVKKKNKRNCPSLPLVPLYQYSPYILSQVKKIIIILILLIYYL